MYMAQVKGKTNITTTINSFERQNRILFHIHIENIQLNIRVNNIIRMFLSLFAYWSDEARWAHLDFSVLLFVLLFGRKPSHVKDFTLIIYIKQFRSIDFFYWNVIDFTYWTSMVKLIEFHFIFDSFSFFLLL